MSDLIQVLIVTLLAAVALMALVRPYVRPVRKKASATAEAGCPGCGTCDDVPAPRPPITPRAS